MGGFRRMAGVQIEEVRGSRSIKGIPYVPRDCELEVEQRLQHRRLLIVGPALSGKSRLAFQLIREIFPEHGFVDAANGRALRAMLEADPGQPRLVIWLDDLPNFLGAEPVTGDVLDLLHGRGNVLVATMDNDSHYRALSDGDLRPSGWGVPAWFGEPVRLTDWSDRELERAALRGVPDQLLESAYRAGLSACVGGGPLLLRWLGAGINNQPVGYAMVRAAGDWQRTGTTEALTRSHLVDLLPAYLNNAPITADTDAIATGLAWALPRVNGAARLEQRGAGYHLQTHIGRHLQVANENIPQALWDAVLDHTSPRDQITVGYTAATNHDRRDIARAAYTLAIDSGDQPAAAQAALYLGRVCQRDGDPNAATAAYRIARESGHPEYGPLAAAWLAELPSLRTNPETPAEEVPDRNRPPPVQGGSEHAGGERAEREPLGGDPLEQMEAYRRRIQAGDPNEAPAAALQLGHLYEHAGDYAAASAAWTFALDTRHAEYAPSAAFQLGMLRQFQDNDTGAAAAWHYAIDSRHPDSAPEAALRLGHLRRTQGDLRRAAACYRLAIGSRHEQIAPKAAIYLGLLLDEHRDPSGAAAAFRVAIDSKHPSEAPEAAVRLGLLLERLNDLTGAAAAFTAATESGHLVHSMDAQNFLDNLGNASNTLKGGAPDPSGTPDPSGGEPDPSGGEPTGELDAELSFFAPEQALRLRRLTREAFLARGLEVTMFSDYVEAADGTEYGLQDMAARCFNAPGGESQWVEIIGQHVDTILGAVQQYDALENLTLDEIFSRTYLRVYDRSFAGETDGYDYGRPIVGDLVELFVLDYPDSVRLLHRTELERFERATLHSAALSNLLAAPIDRYEVFVDDGATMHVAYGQSVHIASKLLILPDVLRRTVGGAEPPHGVLVCVPNRHEIAFHPIVDESVLLSLEHLNQFAAQGYGEGVGSVSPFVYWWQQGKLTQLTRYDVDGQIVVDVDDDFGIVLDKVAGNTHS